MAVVAGKRGQRSYAEQLFARAELAIGAKPLAKVAGTFREGAPPIVAVAIIGGAPSRNVGASFATFGAPSASSTRANSCSA